MPLWTFPRVFSLFYTTKVNFLGYLRFPVWTKQANVLSCPSERANSTTERRAQLDYEKYENYEVACSFVKNSKKRGDSFLLGLDAELMTNWVSPFQGKVLYSFSRVEMSWTFRPLRMGTAPCSKQFCLNAKGEIQFLTDRCMKYCEKQI